MLTKKQTTVQRFDFDGFPIDAQEDVCRQYNGGAAARNEKIFNEADDGAMGGALADALGMPAPPKNTAKTYRKVMGGDYREAGKDYQEANTRAKELKNKKNASTPITTAAKDEEVKSKTVTVKSGTTSKKSKTSKKTAKPAKKSGGKGKGKKVEYAPNAASRVNRPRNVAYAKGIIKSTFADPDVVRKVGNGRVASSDWDMASTELKGAVRQTRKREKKAERIESNSRTTRRSGRGKNLSPEMRKNLNAMQSAVKKLAEKEGMRSGIRNKITKKGYMRSERYL